MRKIIVGFFSVLIVLILIATLSWNMFPSWISHKLSSKAKVAVSIGNIRLSPSSIRVDKIYVGNPPKSILKRALEVDKMTANIPITHFLDKDIIINEMRMSDIYLGLEFESKKNANGNWKTIMNNLKASTKEEKEKARKTNKTRTVLIKRLILEDLKVELVYTKGDRRVRKLRPIERLELTNISSEGGIPSAQIMDIVISETLRNIMSIEGLQNLLKDTLSPGGLPGTILDSVKGLFSDYIWLDNNSDLLTE
ncbi:MAG: AsmA family protein [Simkania negevensis]|nr:AsmA family protein [Simkania negevensis]